MTMYWSLLFIPMLAFLTPIKASKDFSIIQWSIYWIFLTFVIGFRHEVGGDWFHYLNDNIVYNSMLGMEFLKIFTLSHLPHDIGFLFVHWFSQNLFNGIYTTNLVCAAIFTSGLLRLCRATPAPWLALVIATPFLIIVVSMGYTRQSAALGFIMWGLVDLMNGKKSKYYLSIIAAVLLHKAALIMILFGVFSKTRISNKITKKDYFIISLIIVFVSAIYPTIEHMVYYYITNTQMNSSGALIRVSMSATAAIVFFIFKKRWGIAYKDSNLWNLFSIFVLLLLPLVFVVSTAVDRIAIYLLPMQIVIFPRVLVLISNHNTRHLFLVSILTMYALTLYVWINYATHSVYWLPYNNILF